MKFTCTAKELRLALTDATIAIQDRPVTPVRAYARFTVAKGGPKPVRITGSNDYMNVMAAVNYLSADEPGEALVHPGPLKGFLTTLPDDTTLTVETTETHLRVTRTEGSPYTFVLETGEYPATIEVNSPKTAVDFTFMNQALTAVRKSVDADTKAVRMLSTDNTVILQSTDGSRLTQVQVSGAGFGTQDTVLAVTAFEAINRLNPTVISTSKKAVNTSSETASLTIRTENIEFPEFAPILAQIPTYNITVNRAELQEKLRRLHAVDRTAVVSLGVSSDNIVLSLKGSVATYGQETIIVSDGPEEIVPIDLNLEYLLDAVSTHPGDTITLGLSSGREAFRVTSTKNQMEVISVIMPVG